VSLVSQNSSASPLFAVRKRDVCAVREADENILFPGESPMPRWGTTTHENDEGISYDTHTPYASSRACILSMESL
jgi:hypothetical protein